MFPVLHKVVVKRFLACPIKAKMLHANPFYWTAGTHDEIIAPEKSMSESFKTA